MIPHRMLTSEAYQCTAGVPRFGEAELTLIAAGARESPRGRCRILMHPGVESRLHHMAVAYAANSYIRTNKHRAKSESVTVLRGECIVVFFDQ